MPWAAALANQSAVARRLLGQSTRLSQNLIGQLLNELGFDPALKAELQALAAQPGGARADALIDVVHRNPDSTPAAITLLLALRRSGQLDAAAPAGHRPAAIPRRIVQYWPEPPTGEVAQGMEICAALHPGWDHVRFDFAAALDYVAAHFPSEVLTACDRAARLGQFSAVFRLAVLSREGGWFIDGAVRCLAPLESLPRPDAVLWGLQDEVSALSDRVIGCAPGEAVVDRALSRAVEAINRGDNDIPWLATGPGLLTRAFAQVLASREADRGAWLADRFVADRVALRGLLIPDYVTS